MPPKPIKVAVIDLGSNTARLVVMHAMPGYSFRLEDEIREVVRLRHGMDDGLSEDAMTRAFSTLRLFSRFCQSYAVDLVLPIATSAVREAANGAEFAERVERELGLTLRILTGDEEAYYGALGALNEVAAEEAVVLDIGGRQRAAERGTSADVSTGGEALKLGALALTERFVRGDLIRASELEALTQEIERQLESLSWLKRKKGRVLIGLGGTIRNLASMEVERTEIPPQHLSRYVVASVIRGGKHRLIARSPPGGTPANSRVEQ